MSRACATACSCIRELLERELERATSGALWVPLACARARRRRLLGRIAPAFPLRFFPLSARTAATAGRSGRRLREGTATLSPLSSPSLPTGLLSVPLRAI
eukprot:scaffold155737_cov27-Tisochrysis_lutea.AAC.2